MMILFCVVLYVQENGGDAVDPESLSLPLLWTATILALFPRDTPLQRVNTFESLEHLCTWNSCRRNQVKNFKTLKTVRAGKVPYRKRLLFAVLIRQTISRLLSIQIPTLSSMISCRNIDSHRFTTYFAYSSSAGRRVWRLSHRIRRDNKLQGQRLV